MLALAGYTITERVSERRNVNVIVYRGYSDSDADKKPLLFKLLKPVNAHPANRALVQSEYEIIKDIESDGIVKAYGIIDSSAGMVLVSEDFEGVPLNTFQNNGPIDLKTLLPIAIQLANALGDIHKHDIIHKDVRPHTIDTYVLSRLLSKLYGVEVTL